MSKKERGSEKLMAGCTSLQGLSTEEIAQISGGIKGYGHLLTELSPSIKQLLPPNFPVGQPPFMNAVMWTEFVQT